MPSRPIFRPPRRPAPRPTARRRPRQTAPWTARQLVRADVTWSGGLIIGGDDVPTTFEHDQVPADIVVEVDWDGDGDFDQPEEDITAYVLSAETFTGRDWPSQLTGKAGPGRFSGMLNNADDRFSYFNAASPLNQGANSLRTGRKIRVRTVEAEHPDPVLITRDRFQRADGALTATETGLAWVTESADPLEIQGGIAVATSPTTVEHTALVDVGTTDYYLQLTHYQLEGGCYAAIYYRYQDADNYGFVSRNSAGSVRHFSVVAGVGTEINCGTYRHSTNETDDATIGIHVNGDTVTVYLEGVPIGTGAAAPFADTRVGITALWIFTTTPRPGVRSFHVWDGLPTEIEGILWTGDLSDLVSAVGQGQEKTAMLTGEGILARVAAVEVTPEVAVDGSTTGVAVGHILNKAGVMAPPWPLAAGDITTGPWGFDRQNALNLARQFEETEFGFLYENQEGYPAYEARSGRDSSYSLATFSDHPGTQYSYEAISPRDWRREILNKIQAGVAGAAPDETLIIEFTDSNGTAAGVANDVNVTMPTGINRGDLIVLFIASTVAFNDPVQWLEPIWWVALRTTNTGGRQRIYAHICDGTEDSTNILFYDDTTPGGGEWYAHGYVIPQGQWYGSLEGVAVAQHAPGDNPPPLVVPWGLEPSVFFATHTGMVSIGGGSMPATQNPQGYTHGSGAFINGASNGFDLFQEMSWKIDIKAVEDPTSYASGLAAGLIINEATTVAVRGFNGDPIPQSGRTTVELSDLASQDLHGGTVRSKTGPDLFRNTAQAATYCDRVITRHADDRPIFQIGFTATKSAAYRGQAKARRVGHRITLQADDRAGFGVDSDFHIESIGHRFSNGCTLWWCEWELSPANDVLRADIGAADLTAAIDATDTEFQVDVTTPALWITTATHPSMFPFRARCEAEVMLVTGIVGASSPQTFTVIRAFNGFDQAHAAGTPISLDDPWTLP